MSLESGILRSLMLLGACGAVSPIPAAAQEKEDIPSFPFGTPVVVLPVQSALPRPNGEWPGGSADEAEVLEALNAELTFAFGERRAAADWASPGMVVRRAKRNPLLGIDPERVAYQGLIEPIEGQLYEPLHGQLRALAALFGARFVVLPLAVWDRPGEPEEETGAGPRPRRRAVLLVAMIDIRSSRVLWHGEIEGGAAPPDSPALLGTLADRVARAMAPS